jgi:membrane fusion protein, multidrug efflux system
MRPLLPDRHIPTQFGQTAAKAGPHVSLTVTRVRALLSGWFFGVSQASVALGLAACQNAGAGTDRAEPRAVVSVRTVERKDVPVEVRAIGTVEAVSTVAIVPQVTGRVTTIAFTEGSKVKKHDPLFTIDTRPYSASLAAAQAELSKQQALADQAAVEAERYDALAREGLATAQEVARRKADMKSSAAAVESARAQIASASLNVQFATIRAPIDGRTGRVLVHAGNVVQAGDTQPMVVIRSLSPVKVTFTISQELFPELRERSAQGALEVRAKPRGKGARETLGQLTFIDNTVDNATGTLALAATFANQAEELWPGSFVDVVLVLDVDRNAVVAPEAAIAEGQQGAYAFVVDEQNSAQLRKVLVERRTEREAIIQSGLSPGERVVVDGLVRLKQGTRVQINPKTAPNQSEPGTGASGS